MAGTSIVHVKIFDPVGVLNNASWIYSTWKAGTTTGTWTTNYGNTQELTVVDGVNVYTSTQTVDLGQMPRTLSNLSIRNDQGDILDDDISYTSNPRIDWPHTGEFTAEFYLNEYNPKLRFSINVDYNSADYETAYPDKLNFSFTTETGGISSERIKEIPGEKRTSAFPNDYIVFDDVTGTGIGSNVGATSADLTNDYWNFTATKGSYNGMYNCQQINIVGNLKSTYNHQIKFTPSAESQHPTTAGSEFNGIVRLKRSEIEFVNLPVTFKQSENFIKTLRIVKADFVSFVFTDGDEYELFVESVDKSNPNLTEVVYKYGPPKTQKKVDIHVKWKKAAGGYQDSPESGKQYIVRSLFNVDEDDIITATRVKLTHVNHYHFDFNLPEQGIIDSYTVEETDEYKKEKVEIQTEEQTNNITINIFMKELETDDGTWLESIKVSNSKSNIYFVGGNREKYATQSFVYDAIEGIGAITRHNLTEKVDDIFVELDENNNKILRIMYTDGTQDEFKAGEMYYNEF